MVTRRPPVLREFESGFQALSIEGGLLSPDWLARIAHLSAGNQADADYRVPRGLNLRDEISRYWRIAQALWVDFAAGRGRAEPQALAQRFVTGLLRDVLGFDSLVSVPAALLEGRSFPLGHAALDGRVPVVIAPAAGGLDTLSPAFGDGSRRRSAFGLAQEYLNAAPEALWGLASDGESLRLLRDNASLTRPAWIEADLARIFTEERYADFAALRLLAHETRFGREGQRASECPLEAWRAAGREEGTRARRDLRRGVEDALAALGQGFLGHPANAGLRAALREGTLTTQAYFQELLRLVYRLIFLLTVEERGLLHPASAPEPTGVLYAEGYSLRRLRERSLRRSAHDRHGDLWDGVRVVLRGLVGGEPRLGLPALGGLFAADQCPWLDRSRLENRALMQAVFRLCWLREATGLVRVNWRDMGPEEMGSVYEGLLELVPQVRESGRVFAFETAGEARGSARKETGSYYTPDSLVQALLDSALEPVVQRAIATHPEDPAEGVLGLAVLDPACGSGHFLLAAARRLAAHVARLRVDGTPTAAEYRTALRQVVGRCIFGVDRNPLALELARAALWLEAMTADAPLTFVDHHLVCGDALIGLLDLGALRAGVAADAYDPVVGDDKETARRLARRNREGLKRLEKERQSGQRGLSFHDPALVAQFAAMEVLSDDSLEAIARKKAALQATLSESQDASTHPLALAADLLVAAFVAEKTPPSEKQVPTTVELHAVLGGAPLPAAQVEAIRKAARGARALHWPFAFAHVMARGGFDVVLGNPPWDTLSPDAKEFFSQWDAEVRVQSPEDQKLAIERLRADSAIGRAWDEHCRALYTSVAFMKSSGRYKLFAEGNLGKGDFNVYRMFVETALRLVRPGGRAAQIVPEGLYNGANCAAIRSELLERSVLVSLLGFENAAGVWFPGVHRSQKFCLYVAEVPGRTERVGVAFNIRSVSELQAAARSTPLQMPVELVREFSPDALALMEFDSQRDIDIAARMYARHPKFGDPDAGPPQRQYMRELDMGNDRDLFREEPEGVPVYEGRMVDRYDHRAKGYRSGRGRQAEWAELAFSSPDKGIQPQWYVPLEKIPDKVRERYQFYRVGFCDVASPTNERTLVATLIPPKTLCGHSVPTFTLVPSASWEYLVWLAVANSFAMDSLVRPKVSLHMSLATLDSLPFPRLQASDPAAQYLVPRVARLVCTGPEMVAFWNQLASHGWCPPHPGDGVPGTVDGPGRERLEAEIDAYVARELYGLSRDELAHVLDSFPIVAKRDQKAHGEFRTRRLVLEAFDALGPEGAR